MINVCVSRVLVSGTCAALFAAAMCLSFPANAGDVFSDAATWHQGFYGSGSLSSGSTTAFSDKLRAGETESTFHTTTVNGLATGVELTTVTVDYPNPYDTDAVPVSRSETVAYLPQNYADSATDNATIQLTNPFAVMNTGSFTFFVRFKWDGTSRNGGVARFLNAGYHWNNSGFLLGVGTGNNHGKLQVYAKDGATSGSTSCWSADVMVTEDVWTDCAVTVEDSKMTIYTLSVGEEMKSTVMTTTFGLKTQPTSYKTYIRLGGEEGKTTEKQSVFSGYFHAFASWPRALSEDEVRQVFAYPVTPDLVRLGTKNGSSGEFNGATQGGAAEGSATEDWARVSPVLSSASPSQSIPFTVPSHYAGVSQVLRVAFAPDSAEGSVGVSVGETSVGVLVAEPGKSALLTIKGAFLDAGDETLVLTLGPSSGDIVLDAIALGGGFRVGEKNNSKNDLTAHPGGTGLSGEYFAYGTNGILSKTWNDLPRHNNNGYTKQYFRVFVPGEIAGNEECTVVFRSNVYKRGHTFALSVNGQEQARQVCDTANADSANWCAFECEVPGAALVPGFNEFLFANVTDGSYSWCNIDYYHFETIYRKKTGFVLTVR